MQTDEKIKVFISSKCGGESINFDSLVQSESVSKEGVAEKAVRTNYDLVRRALKTSLEETGINKTYLWENSPASTYSSYEDYIYELDSSDVCLFLIDNFDENISNGLLAEITRAQKTNKKSFYLFLNHPQKEITSIQKNLQGITGAHYFQIDDVRKFIDEGYKSVINDILVTYKRYCGDLISTAEQDEISQVDIVEEIFPGDVTDIDKQVFKNLDQTKNTMSNLVYEQDNKDIQTSDFDTVCVEILDFLLGDKPFNDVNISSLLEVLQKNQPSNIHKLVCKRWEAISSYYSGDIEEAVGILKNTYQEFSEDKSISKWLLNDILIDWRNLNIIQGQTEDTIDYSVQEKINQEKSLVFFPLIDRFSTNIYNALWTRNFNLLTNSPYSVSWSNYEHLFDFITNYLFTAIYYGSYTHLEITLEKIKEVFFDLVQKDDNLLLQIQLMRISILRGDERDFKKIFQKYKSALSHGSDKEILDLYNLANTKPLSYQKETWKVMIFSEIGYYLSDGDFEEVSNEIFALGNDWVTSEKPNVSLGEKIIVSFKASKLRLPQEKIIHFAGKIIDNHYIRFYRSLFELLTSLNYSTISYDIVNNLLVQINTIFDDENVNVEDIQLNHLLTKLRKVRDDFDNEIDEIVKEKFPVYFDSGYHLEISPDKSTHIRRYLDLIESRNESQGINGRVTIYADNPYMTLRNILKYSQSVLDEKLFTDILSALEKTLLSETQTYSTKEYAIELLTFLKSWEFSPMYGWHEFYSNLHKNIESIEKGSSSYFFETSSPNILSLHIVLLKIVFSENCLQELIETLAVINNGTENEKIKSLEALLSFLKYEKSSFSDTSTVSILIQYVSNFCFHSDYDIRHQTTQVLYEFLDTQYSSFVIGQLAKMMGDDDYRVKLGVLNQAERIKKYSDTDFNYIISKAKIDKNYLVRRAIEKYAG